MAKFELYEDNARMYRWRLRANNGLIIADSAEGYSAKQGALNGIDLVKRESPTAPIEDHTKAYGYR